MINYATVMAKALKWGFVAARTKAAVERTEQRYRDRADEAQFLSEAMGKLDVTPETVAAYGQVSELSHDLADRVQSIVTTADDLAAVGDGLADQNRQDHGRMREADQASEGQMGQAAFYRRP